MSTQQKIRVRTSAEQAVFARQFTLPNPGDVVIALVFGWSFFCFFLVIGGKRILVQLARMAKSSSMRDAFLSADVQALGGLMLGGCLIFVVSILLVYRYPKLFIGVFALGLEFGNASWKPLHDVALISKYLCVLCMGAIGAFFLYKNIWRLIATPYLRLWFVYIIWTAFVCVIIGGKSGDIWFLGTEVALVIGLAIAWVGFYAKDSEGLLAFCKVLAWVGLISCIINLLAPLLSNQAVYNGRFQGFTIRATMFGQIFAPVVLALFWMSMYEKKQLLRQVFSVFALLAFGLLLWSGTRSAIACILLGVFIMWWVFRTKILYLLVALAFFGLILKIFAGGNTDITSLAGRLQSAETGRVEIWLRYIPIGLQSPIYGYSQSGLQGAFLGDSLGEFFASVGRTYNFQGFHNSYLAMFMKFGGVGLALMLTLLGLSLRRARMVLFSKKIPQEEKKIYVLPVVLMVIIAVQALVEDIISASGKGTLTGLVYYCALIICEVHGRRLYDQYVTSAPQRSLPVAITPALVK